MQSIAKPVSKLGIGILVLCLALLLTLPLGAAADDSGVFISIRLYDGIDPANMAEIETVTRDGFVPIISASDGFLGYYLVLTDAQELAAINLFLTAEQASASNEQARDFVAENLAPLLPNPPTIVEGSVDFGAINFMERDLSQLHASVRVYDGFDMSNQEHALAITQEGFLPLLVESAGFAGYILMNDGVDRTSAITLFDSEAEALASNEKARDFVAANLAEYFPNPPSITSGRAGVAVLNVERWAADVLDLPVFASIRIYDGLDPSVSTEVYLELVEEFHEIIRQSEGFIGYYWFHNVDTITAIALYSTAELAAASNELAREHVSQTAASLVPNPPLIVEGEVQIGFIEMLDGRSDDAVSGLHVSVRVYDDFAAEDLDEFVAIVEGGFLPIMRESDGFFGYYVMTDNDGALAAVSIFDTEASALASNEAARDFVAENLTAYLPSDPLIVSGPLGIAALARLNEGANLIDDRMDPSAFASVRVYDGVDPADQAEIARIVSEGFLPILRESEGFVGYFLLPAEDMLGAMSIYQTAEQTAASTEAARDFVAESLAPLLPNPPLIVQGPMDTGVFALLDEEMMAADFDSLYASLRIYDEVDLSQRAETTALVHSIFLPQQQEAEGFWGYVRLQDGVSRTVALSIFDSEANALTANELAAVFVAEYLSDRPDREPLRLNGQLGVAALAGARMGENLAGALE